MLHHQLARQWQPEPGAAAAGADCRPRRLLEGQHDARHVGRLDPDALVGLAAKNAILMVEFAKQDEEAGESVAEAAVHAARTRLRPILMTSLAFILGVVPLVTASGAGAEMRQSLGTAVFAGMLGVTAFGLLFTPVFYTVMRRLSRTRSRQGAEAGSEAGSRALTP